MPGKLLVYDLVALSKWPKSEISLGWSHVNPRGRDMFYGSPRGPQTLETFHAWPVLCLQCRFISTLSGVCFIANGCCERCGERFSALAYRGVRTMLAMTGGVDIAWRALVHEMGRPVKFWSHDSKKAMRHV